MLTLTRGKGQEGTRHVVINPTNTWLKPHGCVLDIQIKPKSIYTELGIHLPLTTKKKINMLLKNDFNLSHFWKKIDVRGIR